MFYPTSRAIITAALGVPFALTLAVLMPSSWAAGFVWAGAVLLLFFADALLSNRKVEVAMDLPKALAVGRGAALNTLARFSRRAPSEVELLLDADRRVVLSPRRQAVASEGQFVRADFGLLPVRRGQGHIERLWLRWKGPLGLAWRQHVQELDHKTAILPNIPAVKEEAARLFQRNARGGSHLDLDVRQGSEFHALRDWQPGMNRRNIDWKQSARHRLLLAKEFQAEDNLNLVFALDTGRLMCEPLAGLPRIDRALQAALLMAYVGLKLGDRIGLFAFDAKPALNSGMMAGTAAFPVLQEMAAKVDYSTAETNFTLSLTQLGASLERRSIVTVFTEFADTTSAELMLENVSRLISRHTILFVVFRDEEVEAMLRAAPATPEDVSRTILADAMQQDRDKVITRLKRQGVQVVDAPLGEIGLRLIETYMKLKRQERP